MPSLLTELGGPGRLEQLTSQMARSVQQNNEFFRFLTRNQEIMDKFVKNPASEHNFGFEFVEFFIFCYFGDFDCYDCEDCRAGIAVLELPEAIPVVWHRSLSYALDEMKVSKITADAVLKAFAEEMAQAALPSRQAEYLEKFYSSIDEI